MIFKRILFLSIFISQFSCQKQEKEMQLILVNFNEIKTELIQSELKSKFKIDSIREIQAKIPQTAYYKPRNRYRADSLIRHLRDHYQSDKIIGLTHHDISTTTRNHEDFGIMGLAFLKGKSCVVSTFRTYRNATSEAHKNERLKKVVFHEFGHTLGLPHCENSSTCIMRDAGGKVSTIDEEIDFCEPCKNSIQQYLSW